jgi:hypothetical protein
MALIILRNRLIDVRRIVVDELTPQWMRSTLQGLALNLDLAFASRNVVPKPGDLWVGRLPDNGWGNFGTNICWVRGEDVYRAITQLRRADPIGNVEEAELDAPARI